jgi:hypothetical protein
MASFRHFMTVCLTLGMITCPLMAFSAGADCGDGSSGRGSSTPGDFSYPANWVHFWVSGPTEVESLPAPGQCLEFSMSGGCGQVVWQLVGSQDQGGASVDPASGCVTLTAPSCGNYTVSGTDQCNNTVSRTFTVNYNGTPQLRADLYHSCMVFGNASDFYECTIGAFTYVLGLGELFFGKGCASPCGEGGSYGGLDVLFWNVYEWRCP